MPTSLKSVFFVLAHEFCASISMILAAQAPATGAVQALGHDNRAGACAQLCLGR